MLAHELNVGDGGAAGGEARGGLDVVQLDLARHAAQPQLLVLREQTVLENDLAGDGLLEALAGLAADGHDLAHLIGDVVPITGFDLGEVHDVVNLRGAVGNGVLRLEDLSRDASLPERERDGSTHVYVRSCEQRSAAGALAGVDGHHLEVVAPRLVAELLHVCFGGVWVQIGVVNESGEVIEGIASGHMGLLSSVFALHNIAS